MTRPKIQEVSATVGGTQVFHRLPGPWTAEGFKSGVACVLNGVGTNWTRFADRPGAVLCADLSLAQLIADTLNAEHGAK